MKKHFIKRCPVDIVMVLNLESQHDFMDISVVSTLEFVLTQFASVMS